MVLCPSVRRRARPPSVMVSGHDPVCQGRQVSCRRFTQLRHGRGGRRGQLPGPCRAGIGAEHGGEGELAAAGILAHPLCPWRPRRPRRRGGRRQSGRRARRPARSGRVRRVGLDRPRRRARRASSEARNSAPVLRRWIRSIQATCSPAADRLRGRQSSPVRQARSSDCPPTRASAPGSPGEHQAGLARNGLAEVR